MGIEPSTTSTYLPALSAMAIEGGLGLCAGGGHQRLVIIERDDVEDQVRDVGCGGAKKGLGAAGAVLEVQPYHRRTLRLANDGRDLLGGSLAGEAQAERRGGDQYSAQLEKTSTGNAGGFQMLFNGWVFGHCVPSRARNYTAGSCPYPWDTNLPQGELDHCELREERIGKGGDGAEC